MEYLGIIIVHMYSICGVMIAASRCWVPGTWPQLYTSGLSTEDPFQTTVIKTKETRSPTR